MVFLRALTTALLVGLGPIAADAQQDSSGFEVLQEKEETHGAVVHIREWRLRRVADESEIRIVAVVAPHRNTQVSLLPLSQLGASRELFAGLSCQDPLVIINGGFYLRDGDSARPLGLLRVDGKTLSEPSGRRFGGFIVLEGGTVQILTRNQRADATAAANALESTPIIIKDQKDDMLGDDGVRFDRVAIGTTVSGDTFVAGAFGQDQDTISLAEFSKLILTLTEGDRDPPDDVLAMDGGPSAHVFLPRSGTLYGDEGAAYLPNAICVRTR